MYVYTRTCILSGTFLYTSFIQGHGTWILKHDETDLFESQDQQPENCLAGASHIYLSVVEISRHSRRAILARARGVPFFAYICCFFLFHPYIHIYMHVYTVTFPEFCHSPGTGTKTKK